MNDEQINHITFSYTRCRGVDTKLAMGRLRKPDGQKLSGPVRGLFLWIFGFHFQIVWQDFRRTADHVGCSLFTQFLVHI